MLLSRAMIINMPPHWFNLILKNDNYLRKELLVTTGMSKKLLPKERLNSHLPGLQTSSFIYARSKMVWQLSAVQINTCRRRLLGTSRSKTTKSPSQ